MRVAQAPAAVGPSTSGHLQAVWHPTRQPTAAIHKPQQSQLQRTACGDATAVAVAGRRQQQRQAVLALAAEEPGLSSNGAEEDGWVEVGRIGPPHGVRGEMKVQPLTDFPEDRLGTPGPRSVLELLAGVGGVWLAGELTARA